MIKLTENPEPEKVLEISDEMVDAGSTALMLSVTGDISTEAAVAATFMAMMNVYDPDIIFSDGDNKFFKYGDMKYDG